MTPATKTRTNPALALCCVAVAALTVPRASGQVTSWEPVQFDFNPTTFRMVDVSADGATFLADAVFLEGVGQQVAINGTALCMNDGCTDHGWARAISPDGKVILARSLMRGAAIYHDGQWEFIDPPVGHSSLELEFCNYDGSVVFGRSDDHQVIWTPEAGAQVLEIEPTGGTAEVTAVSADGSVFAGHCAEGVFQYCATGFQVIEPPPEYVFINVVAMSPDAMSMVLNARVTRTGEDVLVRWAQGGECALLYPAGGWQQATMDGSVLFSENIVVRNGRAKTIAKWLLDDGAPLLEACDFRTSRMSMDGSTLIGSVTLRSAYSAGLIVHLGEQTGHCPVDLNWDGFVNGDDFDVFAEYFENPIDGEISRAIDLNADCFVNGDDYDLFAEAFEEGC